MGDKHNIFDSFRERLGRRLVSVAALAALALATPAPANESVVESRPTAPAALDRARAVLPDGRKVAAPDVSDPSPSQSPIVSMARPNGAIPPVTSDRHMPARPDTPPLTRAAARLRIEQMSPVRWLSRYGAVSIGQSE